MRPTLRSRLWAAATAFLLGFVVANVGVLVITGADRWIWLAVAVVLMMTGAVGVLLADTPRPLSLWAILGVELLLVLVAVPLLWTFTLATSPDGAVPQQLWPASVSWSAFDLFGGDLGRAALTSLLVAGSATVVAMLVAVPAAYAFVRRTVPGGRAAYALFAAVLVAPTVVFALPSATQVRQLGQSAQPLALVPTTLVIALPLALWLSVSVMRHLPWSLRDAVRADGATRGQELRAFVLPAVAPWLVLVALLVFVVAAGDAVVGAAIASDPGALTLPASLLLTSGTAGSADAAASGLLWLLPVLVLLALAHRRIAHLIARTYR